MLGLQTDIFDPQEPYFPGPFDIFVPGTPTNNSWVDGVKRVINACSNNRFDECRDQWIDDTKWCDNKFTGRKNVACHSWAHDEFERCKKREPSQPFRL
jgi:hypothetical protein